MFSKRTALTILCIVLAVVLLGLVAGAAYLDGMLGLIHREEAPGLTPSELDALMQQEAGAQTGPVYDPEDITIPQAPENMPSGEGILNILLIGQDRREGSGRSLSDAMILCTLNRNTGVLTMTSFLRDSYVRIPGHGNNKLNAAYPLGGMTLLDATLEENFGVRVDGNVEVDFSQFRRIIDLLGGVEISLTEEEVQHLAREYGFQLREGVNRLNGEEALGYARIRKLGTDFARTERQRKVLTALIGQFRRAGLLKLHKATRELLKLITTDMSNSRILALAVELAPMLDDLEIRSQHIPAEGTYRFGNAGKVTSCIFLDFEANRALLAETLWGDG